MNTVNLKSINRRSEGSKVSMGEPKSKLRNRGEIGAENKKHKRGRKEVLVTTYLQPRFMSAR